MTWHTKRDGEWKHSNGLSRARSQFKFEGAWVFAKNNSPVEEPGSNIRILHYMKVAGVWRLTTELPSTLADYGVTLTTEIERTAVGKYELQTISTPHGTVQEMEIILGSFGVDLATAMILMTAGRVQVSVFTYGDGTLTIGTLDSRVASAATSMGMTSVRLSGSSSAYSWG